jgi:hypothetical protein
MNCLSLSVFEKITESGEVWICGQSGKETNIAKCDKCPQKWTEKDYKIINGKGWCSVEKRN